MVALVALVGVLVVVALPPLRQSQEYHGFADHRALFGIPSVLNVISNVGFLFVGWMGMDFLVRRDPMGGGSGLQEPVERLLYGIFFLGVGLTGLGSACYHWTPNDSLPAYPTPDLRRPNS